MSIPISLKTLVLSGWLVAIFVPQTALAAEAATTVSAPPGPVGECLTQSGGVVEAFLACLRNRAEELGWPEGWQERVEEFLDNHPDWAARLRNYLDRREDRRDRWEDRRDRLEDWRDRWEDRRDRMEDRWDRWEDRWDRRRGV